MAHMSFAKKISDIKYAAGPEIERTSKDFMRKRVPSDRGLRILDVGCGTGLNATELRKAGHVVVGIDISQVAIDKLIVKGFEAHCCDVTTGIPLDSNSVDLVYASEVIEHVDDTAKFLGELSRVLKPGGILLLSTVNSSFWVFRLFSLFGRTVSEVQHPGHIRFFSKRSLRQAVENAGFTNVNISARHIYLILSGSLARKLERLWHWIGLHKEIRFKTMQPFWHFSRYAQRANPLFSDTLILMANKK